MTGQALGLIEAVGLPAAVAAADAAVKAANVKLLGYELTKGGGLVIIKLEGDVGAIKAAVDAGAAEAKRVHGVWAVHVIPRPAGDTNKMLLADLNVPADAEKPLEESAAQTADKAEDNAIEKPVENLAAGSPDTGGKKNKSKNN